MGLFSLQCYRFSRTQGYTVDDRRGYWMDLDTAKLATLEAADLIIVSRTTNSGNYSGNATEVTQRNSLSTPPDSDDA